MAAVLAGFSENLNASASPCTSTRGGSIALETRSVAERSRTCQMGSPEE